MNFKKWENPAIPLPVLVMKLSEEVGEVAGEMCDASANAFDLTAMTTQPQEFTGPEIRKLVEELGHVEFIAGVIKRRLIGHINQRAEEFLMEG